MSPNYSYNFEDKSITISGNVTDSKFYVNSSINGSNNQDLVEAAAVIRQILEYLSEKYPTLNTEQKTIVVAKAIDIVESKPALKNKAINALKAGGKEAFKEAINHPLANILVSMIDGWNSNG